MRKYGTLFDKDVAPGKNAKKLRLGAQSVTLLSTLRDPTQLRRHPCAFRKQPLLFVPMKAKNSNSYCSSEGRNRLNPKKYS